MELLAQTATSSRHALRNGVFHLPVAIGELDKDQGRAMPHLRDFKTRSPDLS
jgi:hypothetical protein